MLDGDSRRFFNLDIDVYVPGRWYMSAPTLPNGQEFEDPWSFTRGERIADPGRLCIPLSRPGIALDYTTAGFGSAPILSARAAAIFREMAPNDIQLFPVEVEGQKNPYYLMVAAREIRCIDDKACEDARYFDPENWPNRAGEYQVISGLRIDKSKVGDARVFKLWGWGPALIVIGEMKAVLEQTGIVGGLFEEV